MSEVKRGSHFTLYSECREVLEPMLDTSNTNRSTPYAVVIQGAAQCVRLWKRDVSTCRNIRDVFIHDNSHQGQQPEKFTRASDPNKN